MNPHPPDNDELLSGMLDGELSGIDARRIEQAMRDDPTLQERLNELTAMRSALLRGRPTGRLSGSFAAGVVAAAQQRAAAMEMDAPDWIPQSVPSATAGSRPKLEPSYRQRLWIPAGAFASACVIAIFVLLVLPRPGVQQIADLPPFSDSSTNTLPPTLSDSPDRVADALASAKPADITEPAKSTKPADEPAEASVVKANPSEPASTVNPEAIPSMVAAADAPKGGSSDATTSKGERLDTSSLASSAATSQPVVASSNTSEAGKAGGDVSRPPFMLMVVTVSMDKVARQNDALNRILNDHGIASVEDLALSSEQLDALLSTGMAGSVSQEGAGVFFLKGYAKSLSGALDDICSQYKDFPEFGLNIAMDDSARTLVDQLDGIQVAANKGVAKRLGAKTPEGLVSSFAPGARRSSPLSEKRREEFRSQAAMPRSDLNPISHLLLIVRDAE